MGDLSIESLLIMENGKPEYSFNGGPTCARDVFEVEWQPVLY